MSAERSVGRYHAAHCLRFLLIADAKLHHAQLAHARVLGFASWPKLKAFVGARMRAKGGEIGVPFDAVAVRSGHANKQVVEAFGVATSPRRGFVCSSNADTKTVISRHGRAAGPSPS